jgi:tRNA pseudouridine38-40 synthase
MRYKAIISYDGSSYAGWATQNNKITVQGEVQSALLRLTGKPIKVTASGRTDAFVHALGQVIHFDLDFEIKCQTFQKGLNKILPLSIRVDSIVLVNDDFHARFSAKSKEYHYLIKITPPSVFEGRYYSYYPGIDLFLVKKALDKLIGTHDFLAFTPTPPYNKPTIKTIFSITLVENGDYLKIIFIGDGFLKYSIRSMMGCVIDIAHKKKNVEIIDEMFTSRNRLLASKSASPNGLYLFSVNY